MNRNSPLDQEILIELGFNYDGEVWIHYQDYCFAIQLESSCFYIACKDNITRQHFNPTVGELEKEFKKQTGHLLFEFSNTKMKGPSHRINQKV